MNEKYHSDVETTYTAVIADTDDAELTAQREAAEQYNAMLSGAATITKGGAFAPPLAYAQQLTVGGVMCYIDIPKISVYLPVQHGTSAETLERAVGHVAGTSDGLYDVLAVGQDVAVGAQWAGEFQAVFGH